ncbi:c-type cytochrome [Sinorhizobium psoraleae]|uniref:C-type cytochrome n=1 Tax=Sinorhizobium psoraleae TaxID=520838 RepID=A0ABT4KQ19_9HYPH|nr:c-type cytochrome [Sinorhizobium psoraleae]MCZ4094061.1 c-type cytochrome [Sinorhizobium psoraleae]
MIKVVIALTFLITAGSRRPPSQGTGAAPAQRLFQQRCGACHQIATPRNGVGPNLQGIVGRAAGAVEGFRYSPALKDSGVTWTPRRLRPS